MHSNMWHSLCNEVPSMQPGKVSSSVQGDLFPLSRGRTGRTCPSPQSLQEYSVTPGSCNSFWKLSLCYTAWNPVLARLLPFSSSALAFKESNCKEEYQLFTFYLHLTFYIRTSNEQREGVRCTWNWRTCSRLLQYIYFLILNVTTVCVKILQCLPLSCGKCSA